MTPAEAKRRAGKRYRWKVRREVLCFYGGQCRCCAEKRDSFLQLNHVHGGGSKHRREVSGGSAGWRYFVWLRKNGYPDGYDVLCANCHQSFTIYGNCVHAYQERLGESEN